MKWEEDVKTYHCRLLMFCLSLMFSFITPLLHRATSRRMHTNQSWSIQAHCSLRGGRVTWCPKAVKMLVTKGSIRSSIEEIPVRIGWLEDTESGGEVISVGLPLGLKFGTLGVEVFIYATSGASGPMITCRSGFTSPTGHSNIKIR